ncbi:sigma-70 family RNA polymerase sigma factor [Plesiocystis pacifica]|uniref:RNA polymerase sigma factor n=1 Tax=Plesiocystis pacifica TaxID=191768 RepID=UPI000A311BF9
MQSDAELFAAASQGDQDAFAALVRRHRRWAELYARKCGAGADAADVAQEAFLKLLRSEERELRSKSLRALLRVDIHFRVLRLHQRRARQLPLAQSSAFPAGETDISDMARNRRIVGLVQAAIQRLRSSERRLLTQHYTLGMRPVEIAQQSGRSGAAVRSALYRARNSLRAELGLVEQ